MSIDYDLCTDCISKELATLEKQSPDHTRTHNMIRLITPLPTWHTMIEMPKWRNIIGEFMLTNSGQADLKCSGICDTADFEGDIYKCIDCGRPCSCINVIWRWLINLYRLGDLRSL